MAMSSGIDGVPYETVRTVVNQERIGSSDSNLPPGFLPPKFWGLDPVFNTLPKFYIGDIVAMPELNSHPGECI